MANDAKKANNVKRADTPKDDKLATKSAVSKELAAVEEEEVTDFTSILYDGFSNVFGNMNPFQMFALNWPATVLDERALTWDPDASDNVMPPDVRTLTSQLFDTYIPPSPITQTDGTRVSDRYIGTISQLGPIPNAALLDLQRIIREKLKKTIIVNEDGQEVELSVSQWYDRLYSQYLATRKVWGEAQFNERQRLRNLYPGQPDEQNNLYLQWYNLNAQRYLSAISEAHSRLIATFPLREWEAAISILDTSSDHSLVRAKELLRDLTIPIPTEYGGGNYVPSTGVPLSWSTDLKTSVGELDLLETPAAKHQALSNAIRALEAEVQAWSAIMPDVADEEVRLRLLEFQTHLQSFSEERTKLSQEWGGSVYVVVEAVAAYQTSFSTTTEKFISAMTNTVQGEQSLTQNLANATDSAYGLGAGTATYERVKELVKKIVDQQNGVWAQQDKALDAGATLAGAATTWLDTQGRQTGLKWIFSYIEQLKMRVDSLRRVQAELIQASMMMWKKMWDPEKERRDGTGKGAYVPLTEKEIPQDDNGRNMTARKDYDPLGEPNPFTSAKPDTWTKVIMTLSKSQMESSERMKTTFKRRQWGVNFFSALMVVHSKPKLPISQVNSCRKIQISRSASWPRR